MYGWRARFGLVIPANNTVIEPEFSRMVPKGVASFATKILSHGLSAEGIDRMVENSHRAIDELAVGDMSAFAYACLATSLFQADVESKTGKPATTAATATIEALQSVGASRVALATPYPDTINDLLPGLFSAADIEVVSLESVAVKDSLEVCRLDPSVAYGLAKQADTDKADAVCILATDIRSVDVLNALETDIGKPAISTNQALLWRCLRFCDIGEPVDGFGFLLTRASV
jgi:maleate cis-trans isomerase